MPAAQTKALIKPNKSRHCQMCGRDKPLTFHHLIPKRNHRRTAFKKRFSKADMLTRGAWLCRQCHSKIHQVFSEKDLGLHFNTLESIMAEPEIERFLNWVRKQK